MNEAAKAVEAAGLAPKIMIDASHGNSSKKAENQVPVSLEVGENIAKGDDRIIGLMIESNLVGGRQDHEVGKKLVYGQSVTDACIGWEDSSKLLGQLAETVKRRRDVLKK